MPNVVNYIFNSLDKNETDIKAIKKCISRNSRAHNRSVIVFEIAIILLAREIYLNSKKIEKMEKEIKELKGE